MLLDTENESYRVHNWYYRWYDPEPSKIENEVVYLDLDRLWRPDLTSDLSYVRNATSTEYSCKLMDKEAVIQNAEKLKWKEYAKLYASIHPKVIPPFETPLLKEETVYKP